MQQIYCRATNVEERAIRERGEEGCVRNFLGGLSLLGRLGTFAFVSSFLFACPLHVRPQKPTGV